MDILGIIQARMGSKRLPEKVFKTLGGKKVLEHVIHRASASRYAEKLIVATSFEKEDDRIEELCDKLEMEVFRGSETDLLDRFYQAAKHYKPEHVMCIKAHCPVLDPELIDQVLEAHLDGNGDYTSNTLNGEFSAGQEVEVFTFQALQVAWENAKSEEERSDVTLYFRNHPDDFKLDSVKPESNLPQRKLVLETDEDFHKLKALFEEHYEFNELFGLMDLED